MEDQAGQGLGPSPLLSAEEGGAPPRLACTPLGRTQMGQARAEGNLQAASQGGCWVDVREAPDWAGPGVFPRTAETAGIDRGGIFRWTTQHVLGLGERDRVAEAQAKLTQGLLARRPE